MKTVCLHEKGLIEDFLRRNPFLHLYSLGDLDDRFWPATTWYARTDGDRIHAIALLFSGLSLPTLLAIGDERSLELPELVRSILHLLPRRFYAHLSPGAPAVLAEQYAIESRGLHHKMALAHPGRLGGGAEEDVFALSPSDANDVLEFYGRSHPGNWFEPQMFETDAYYGRRIDGRIVSVAGVHVVSPTYRVAALGNIVTHPADRGQGHARAVTGALCRNLLRTVDHVGLNVKADNAPALRCYRALGFEVCASYEEAMVEPRGH